MNGTNETMNAQKPARPALPVAAQSQEPMTSALAIIDPRAAIAPRNMDDVWNYCVAVAKVGLCGVRSPEEALIRMSTGMELGLTPMQSMRGIYLIEGRPGLDAALMVGLCLRRPDICEAFDLVESTDKIATYSIKRRGRPAIRFSYTIEQAKEAGLLDKKNWKANRAAMLRARASSQGARAVFPDLTNGLYSGDELEEAGVVATVQAERVTYDATPIESVVEEKVGPAPATTPATTPTPTQAATRPATTAAAPQPPAQASAPDFDAMSHEAASLIQAAKTIEEIDGLKSKLSKLAPKGTPHREALVAMLTARREEILNAPPPESPTQDVEPDFAAREGFE